MHSTVEFAVTHMPFSWFRGRFRELEGTVLLDEAEPQNSSVAAAITVASIDVLGERFQAVMLGEDFFDAALWPSIAFQSTAVQQLDDRTWHVTGDLTIRGVTRPV